MSYTIKDVIASDHIEIGDYGLVSIDGISFYKLSEIRSGRYEYRYNQGDLYWFTPVAKEDLSQEAADSQAIAIPVKWITAKFNPLVSS